MAETFTPTYADVLVAQERLGSRVNHPEAIFSGPASDLVGAEVWLMPENLQPTGSFKDRGASNAIAVLAGEGRQAVCTISSGNHAAAVARAGKQQGLEVFVRMAMDSPPTKQKTTADWGAHIEFYDRYRGPQAEIGQAYANSLGLELLSPYDNPHVIAGAGTAALDLFNQIDDLDTIIGPLGGGGLIAGTALTASAKLLGCRVVGVEPEQHKMWAKSLQAGRRLEFPIPATVADGQQLTTPGELTFSIIQNHGVETASAKETSITDAMAWLFDNHKLIAEPSGAIALAALFDNPNLVTKGSKVGVFISGGNVNAKRFAELVI